MMLNQRLLSVFPAYAGVIPSAASDQAFSLRIPRVCRGDTDVFSDAPVTKQYSPRLRG